MSRFRFSRSIPDGEDWKITGFVREGQGGDGNLRVTYRCAWTGMPAYDTMPVGKLREKIALANKKDPNDPVKIRRVG